MASAQEFGELRAFRRLARALRTLPPILAPAGLAERVLDQVGEQEVRFATVETQLGPLFVVYGSRGIRTIAPAGESAELVSRYQARFGSTPLADPAPPVRLLRDVARAIGGDRTAARRLPLDLEPLGEFERAVLAKALEIPRGQVRPYGWVAREIGRPEASRAVGRALGRNPIPFIIPCHRVVGSSGDLTGYAFGLDLKRRVLDLEGVNADALVADVRRGERYLGSRSTRIFCFPTCHNARRVGPGNAVPFRTEIDARQAGYRPCRVCRPAAVGA